MQALNILSGAIISPMLAKNRVKALLASISTMLYIYHERARNRRVLSMLDDRLLRDMGISVIERDRECAKPFWKA